MEEDWDNIPGVNKGSEYLNQNASIINMEEDWDNIPGVNKGPEYLDQNASIINMEEDWDNIPGVNKGSEYLDQNAPIINMEEDWDNIPGVNKGPEYLDQNASSHAVESKYSWCNEDFNIDILDLTKINSNTCNASTNYTDWYPTNNNGHTDDDKLINIHCNYHTNKYFDDTGCADSNQSKSDVEYQTDTSDNYKNNGQTNPKSADPQFTNDSWGNPISYDQATNSTDTGNYSEFDGFTNQNNYNNSYHQKSKNSGFHKSGRGYLQDAQFAKKSNINGYNNKKNGKLEEHVIQKSTYIPPKFEKNDDLTMEAGLHFEKYDKIKVTVSGMEVPKNITSFHNSGLHKILITNLTKCHYYTPTPIQKYAIPIIMNGKDMIVSAQTGSGKTEAFVLPILNNLISEPSELVIDYNHCEPQVLILSPTRDLAIQICEVTTKLSRHTSIQCELLYGGTAIYNQKEKILRGVHIIVATPGHLIDFVNRGLITFSSLRFFVLDDADQMLDMGFSLNIERILTNNTMVSSAERSTIMFSAKLRKNIQQIAKCYLKPDYISVAIEEVGGTCKDATQTFIEVNKPTKKKVLVALLNETNDCQGTIVFVEQKRQADFLAALLSELNYPTTSLHGGRLQPEREKALRDFKTKKMKVLVATDVAARGLDITGVTMVINFDLPKTIEEYVHRIGRTGKLGNCGRVISFYDPAYDSGIAPFLVNTLKLADQDIPEFLSQYSSQVQEPFLYYR